ncbi:MAG TPA: Calx-beta domain-containing protein [Thermoanaerobaculia bacterium]|nr:Calx-beta domain-containing protein [Thermoanaerobaculia bacterium]
MHRLVVVFAVAALALGASAQIQVVSPASPAPWQFTTSGTGTPVPASWLAPGFDTPPLGTGSVHLAVGSNGAASAQARNTAYAGTLLSQLEVLSYSTFIDVTGATPFQAPYLNLLIDRTGDGVSDDQLFFEPAYQTGTYPGDPVPNQGTVTPGVWQTWNAMTGGWWALSAGTGGPPLVTLATYIAANPTATIVNSAGGLGGIRIVAGLGPGAWDNFLGAADNVSIDTTTTSLVTYNFEPDPGTVTTVTVPTPDGWSLQTVNDADATNTATIDITPAPAPAPLGDGALRLAVGADGGDAAQARSTNWDGQFLMYLTSLSYWTYVQQDGSGGQAPYLMLDVDYNGDNVRDDILFFEPLYQSATYFPSDPQPALVTGAWQQWDARDGGWWSLNGTAGAGAGTNVKPLSAILEVEPDARLTGTSGGAVRIVAGFGEPAWNNFIGFADALGISFNLPIVTYDFEPVPTITIGDVTQNEGTGGTTTFSFTLTLSEAVSQNVTVQYTTTDGTATAADLDYTATSSTATFTAGSTTATINVSVTPDAKLEDNETFFVNLSTPTFATIADPQAIGTIVNDDPVPTITIADPALIEQNSGTNPLSFVVQLSNPSENPVSVDYTVTPGTATPVADYVAPAPGTLIIPAGATSGTISVTVVGETLFEPDETLFLNLSNPTGAMLPDNQATGTILNDDVQPSITINDVTQGEGNAGVTPFVFTVTLSNPTTLPVSVNYTTTPDTATTGLDFVPAAGVLLIAPGTTSNTITVDVVGDTLFEPNEQFFVNLSDPVNATFAEPPSGLGTIVDDEAQPTIIINDVSQNEGNAGTTPFTFTVTLSGPSANAVSINWTTAPGTAISGTDFTPSSGNLIIPAGSLTGTIVVDVIGDTAFEPNETFFVNLTTATGGTIVDNQGQGTIVNDDGPVADVSITKSGPTAARPNTPITYAIVVSNAGPQAASNVVVTDTIPAGTTFTSATPSQGSCSGTSTVTCTLGTIAAGGTATITLIVQAPGTPATLTNTATVTNTPEVDPNPANNTSGPAIVAVAEVAGIPTVSEWGLLALLMALAAAAALKLR